MIFARIEGFLSLPLLDCENTTRNFLWTFAAGERKRHLPRGHAGVEVPEDRFVRVRTQSSDASQALNCCMGSMFNVDVDYRLSHLCHDLCKPKAKPDTHIQVKSSQVTSRSPRRSAHVRGTRCAIKCPVRPGPSAVVCYVLRGAGAIRVAEDAARWGATGLAMLLVWA